MKQTTRCILWPKLILFGGVIMSAIAVHAGKPTPPSSSGLTHTTVVLGGLRASNGGIYTYASDINNSGQVVGQTSIPGYDSGYYSQAFLINPKDVNNDGKLEWFVDAVDNVTGTPGSDGQNDLIIPLGTLPTCATCGRHGFASAINDLGVVVGSTSDYDFSTKVATWQAFIVVPKDKNGADCWYEDSNADGFNDLMIALGRPAGVPDSFAPTDLNVNNAGQVSGRFYDPNGTSRVVGFLLTPVKDPSGAWTWSQLDSSGQNALMESLGDFIPNGINDNGQLVGMSYATLRAQLRNPDGSIVDLGLPGIQSEADAINNTGQISVWFKVDGVGHAGLLTPKDINGDGVLEQYQDSNGDGFNDLVVDLGNLKGMENSYVRPQGLNDAGSVIGGSWHASRRDGLGYVRAAFLWENGILQSLQDLTGGTIEFGNAYAINSARQILADGGGRQFDASNGRACILLPIR